MSQQIVEGNIRMPRQVEIFFRRFVANSGIITEEGKHVLPSGLEVFVKSRDGSSVSRISCLHNMTRLQEAIDQELIRQVGYDIRIADIYAATEDYMIMPLLKLPTWSDAACIAGNIRGSKGFQKAVEFVRERYGFVADFFDPDTNRRLILDLSGAYRRNEYPFNLDPHLESMAADITSLASRHGLGYDLDLTNVFVESYDTKTNGPGFVLIDQEPST